MAPDKIIQLTWLLLTYHIAIAETENDTNVDAEDGVEIQNSDPDDESPAPGKNLLDSLPPASDDPEPRNVVVDKMIFLSEGRDAIELDLTDETKLDKWKDTPITIKEGCEYKLQIVFQVKREVVEGLRLLQTTFRNGIRIDRSNIMVGGYGPNVEHHIFTTNTKEAPKGMVNRGLYTVKSRLADDKNVYFEWEWSFDIKEDWD